LRCTYKNHINNIQKNILLILLFEIACLECSLREVWRNGIIRMFVFFLKKIILINEGKSKKGQAGSIFPKERPTNIPSITQSPMLMCYVSLRLDQSPPQESKMTSSSCFHFFLFYNCTLPPPSRCDPVSSLISNFFYLYYSGENRSLSRKVFLLKKQIGKMICKFKILFNINHTF